MLLSDISCVCYSLNKHIILYFSKTFSLCQLSKNGKRLPFSHKWLIREPCILINRADMSYFTPIFFKDNHWFMLSQTIVFEFFNAVFVIRNWNLFYFCLQLSKRSIDSLWWSILPCNYNSFLSLNTSKGNKSKLNGFTDQGLDSWMMDIWSRMIHQPAVGNKNQCWFVRVFRPYFQSVIKSIFALR